MIKEPEFGEGALLGAMLRWQVPQGKRMRQEFVAIQANNGEAKLNPAKASQWLLTPAEHGTLSPDTEISKLLFKAAEGMANQRLADASNRYLIPENLDWAAAGWTRRQLKSIQFNTSTARRIFKESRRFIYQVERPLLAFGD